MYNQQDYNFRKYQTIFNKTVRKILKESYEDEFDAENISREIDEAQITYKKIQKILSCPEMIKSHAYLYSLDQENVDECDKVKVDKLYELGKARGVIQEDEEENNPDSKTIDECDEIGDICGGPDDALSNQEMTPGTQKSVMSSAAFTVLYSAMKDGEIKTGEFFSSATDMEAAKNDCVDNLTPLGYSSIRILGIEKTQNAVDMSTLGEDDSEEYENQETGVGDVDTDEDTDANSEEDTKKDDTQDDSTTDDTKKNKSNGEEPKKSDDEDKKEDSVDTKDTEDDEDVEDEDKKLTATQKKILRDEYTGMFKSELQKTKLQKSVEEMTIKEKADFWKTIAEKWTKEEPEEFMSDKEIEKLNKTVIKNN